MRLSKDLHRFCPGCGAEADGLEQVEKVFGFHIEKDELTPKPYCRKCRSKRQAQFQKQKSGQKNTKIQKPYKKENASDADFLVERNWAEASTWAKRIHTSREVFIKYLIDLGYLTPVFRDECNSDYEGHHKCAGNVEAKGTTGPLQLTEKGRLHSAITNRRHKDMLLWDYRTFVDVMLRRSQKAIVSDYCPRCGFVLEEGPEFDHNAFAYLCHHCGKVCDYYTSKVVFNE